MTGTLTEPVTDVAPAEDGDPDRRLRLRLVLSAVSAVPVIVLSTVPALQFTWWQWIALTLAAPVAIWGAWPFHRAAADSLRRGRATADTLTSLGVLTAFGWSLYALVFGLAGDPGRTQTFTPTIRPLDGTGVIYLDVVVGVTAVLLAVRCTEVRSRRSGGGAVVLGRRQTDRAAAVLVPLVVAVAAATLGFWLGTGVGTGFAITAAVAVLVVACPGALVLAVPTALLAGITRGARLGVLISGPEVLAAARRVDTVLLDTTGTATVGRMTLEAVHVADGVDADEALRLAGAAGSRSRDPIAVAVTAAAREKGPLPELGGFAARAGLGVQAEVGEHGVLIGRPALLEQWCQPLPPALAEATAREQQKGHSTVAVAWDGQALAVLAVADPVRPTSARAAAQLRRLGVRPVLLTGDNPGAAHAVAEQIGITEVIADTLPEGKADVVARLRREGHAVALVGDAHVDAVALDRADLGLVVGGGADGNALTLLRPDLDAVSAALRLTRRTSATMRGGLVWAVLYNAVAIPLATTGLVDPLLAGAATAACSLVVLLGGVRLRAFR